MISFTIPALPPSVNQIYKKSKNHVYLNQKVVDWRKIVKAELDKLQFHMSSEKLRVEVVYYVTKTNIDLDNLNKSMFDALNKIVYEDDRQIYEILCKKVMSILPKTEIRITEMI